MSPDGGEYTIRTDSGKPVVLSPEDIIRCREISIDKQRMIVDIARLVSKHTGIPLGYIRGKRRTRPITAARWLVCYLAHDKARFTLEDIGRAMNLDHTSVLHGVKQERIRRGEA